MVSFIKDTSFRRLAKENGVKRMFKSSQKKITSDLRAYAILLDLLAKSAAAAQGRKIVQPEHVTIAEKALEMFSS